MERIHCKKGYIDRLVCDVGHDPNNPSARSKTTFYKSVYYRLNGEGKWVPSRFFKGMTKYLNFKDEFESDHIWETSRTGFTK